MGATSQMYGSTPNIMLFESTERQNNFGKIDSPAAEDS